MPRRVNFSVPALKQAASAVMGMSECTEMIKLPEGLFNRAFLLTFDNGTEAVARLPTSLAGPPRLTTASEVATLKLMGVLGIPVPKVLGYSCTVENEVGAEYIIMERAKGVSLQSVWGTLRPKERGKIIAELVGIDSKMLAVDFAGYGSVFSQEDLCNEDRSIALSSNPDFHEFRIGPCVQREFWSERISISIGRGPCLNSNILADGRGKPAGVFIWAGETRNLLDSTFRSTAT
jgi:aminoglycoside phosphotransferase (APT) family kinase protein